MKKKDESLLHKFQIALMTYVFIPGLIALFVFKSLPAAIAEFMSRF